MEKAVNNSDHYLNEYRYERKFILKNILLDDIVDTIVYTNPYCFEEIFNQRTVNNIYFDDNNHSCYHQNVSGTGLREKYRLRWYSEYFSEISNSTFEIKKKYGELGTKSLQKLKSLKIDITNLTSEDVYSEVSKHIQKCNNKKLIAKYHNLFPSLYNSYQRRYFLSNCKKFRITLDYNMIFLNPNLSKDSRQIDEIILELKHNKDHDNEARHLTQKIKYRLSKNSKYVRGIDLINFKTS